MNKKEIIKDLEKNIYCRIRPSRIHGVGVFAIKPIPKGAEPLATFTPVDVVAIPTHEIMGNRKIPGAVKNMVRAFYAEKNGKIYCDARSLNEINISYFLNHSKKPNLDVVERDDETHFIANRKIRAGEELTSDHSLYSDVF